MSKNKKDTAAEEKQNSEAKAAEGIKNEDTKKAATPEKPEEKAADKKPEDGKGDKKPEEKKPEEKKPEEKKPEVKKPTPAEELAALNDKYLRVCAEYDNFRKRSLKEREGLYGDIKAETLKTFLPVYDNLMRALSQPTADEAYRKGVEMTVNQFNSTLEKLGVKEIECLGKTFDPKFHNAVMHVEDEEKGENEIVEVFQKGFIMGDKVIRFAMVKVAN